MSDILTVAVMQPYLFPYLGYQHLIHAADTFVVLDDVAYIKRGWINRNRILERGESMMVTLPVARASQNRTIAEHRIAEPGDRDRFAARVRGAYRACSDVIAGPLLDALTAGDEDDLTTVLIATLQATAAAAGTTTTFVRSSDLDVPRGESAERRIIDLVLAVGGTRYVNLPGGRDLYDADSFAHAGLVLRFVDPPLRPYPQEDIEGFEAGLSVLDVAHHHDESGFRAVIADYDLVP